MLSGGACVGSEWRAACLVALCALLKVLSTAVGRQGKCEPDLLPQFVCLPAWQAPQSVSHGAAQQNSADPLHPIPNTTPHTGLPKAPAISAAAGGKTDASVTWAAVATATSYTVVPIRGTARGTAVKVTALTYSMPLERGSWKLEVTASNAFGASLPATTGALTIGVPDPVEKPTAARGAGLATLTFK